MTFANILNPDEAPQNVGPHLEFKLFGTQIHILSARILDGNKTIENIFSACKDLKTLS